MEPFLGAFTKDVWRGTIRPKKFGDFPEKNFFNFITIPVQRETLEKQKLDKRKFMIQECNSWWVLMIFLLSQGNLNY